MDSNTPKRSASRFRRVGALLIGAALTLAPLAALADAYAPPAADAQAIGLFKLGKEKKSSYALANAKFKVGHAEIFVDAPIAKVKAAVLDYGNYSAIMPRFEKSKLLKQNGQAAQVYLQVPILHGAAVIWAIENFAAPAADGAGEKVIGTMQKGNVTDFRATWRYRAVDDQHSVVSADIYIEPNLDVPEDLLTSQVEDACGDGVRGVKQRAEAATKVASVP